MPKINTPSRALTVRLGQPYMDALRYMKRYHKICTRDILEQGIATYMYQIHDWKNKDELASAVGCIRGEPQIKATQWWVAPDPLPATVTDLGLCPSADFDPKGHRAWFAARKAILARSEGPQPVESASVPVQPVEPVRGDSDWI